MTEILISNERWKAVSSLAFTLCAGLIAGIAVHVWEVGNLDYASTAWVLMASALGFAEWKTLSLLVSESL
jgi:hypothetical protein